MKIKILSNKKYNRHLGEEEYIKSEFKEVSCFVYDEDVFWFDFGKKRFGISIPQILKLRRDLLKSLKEED